LADSYTRARIPCARYLARLGFQVIEASSARRALEAITSTHPHVVIADAVLTRFRGRPDERLAWEERTREIPVIVMSTGFGDSVESAPLRTAGVLVKPFRLTHMVNEVRRVLRSWAASRLLS
jgi:DNA-binding response OmpR family regulator